MVKDELGLKTSKIERLHQFKPDDTDIFINLRFSKASPGRRSKHRVVIFTDDKARVAPVLERIKSLGFSKDSYVTDEPNRNWNIKWGAADTQTVNEILGVIKQELDISSSKIKRLHQFEPNDNDIFVNLRFSKSDATPSASGRGKHRVVIFTNDEQQVTELLRIIKDLGYSSESHIAEKPNDDWNIKWGAASAETIDELLQVIDKEMGIPPKRLRKSHEFEAKDNDIFINLKF
jgi:hypothetical protein